jgi:sarcosine oxidase
MMPVFIWEQAGKAQPIYGFPAVSGPAAGVKIATEGRQEVDPDTVDRREPSEAVQAMHETYIKTHFPRLGPRVVRSAVCLYTVVAGGRFVIDRHPKSERITFVSACSGHGFKHSAAIGEALADRICTGKSRVDLDPFAISLFAG